MEETVPKSLMPYLNGLLNRMPLVKAEWQVEDLCQELALKFLHLSEQTRNSLDEDHKLALLKVMAVHVCKDQCRYVTRAVRDIRKKLPLSSVYHNRLKPKVDSEPEPFTERFQKFKFSLKPEYQEVLELRLQGLTWEQVAEKMKPKKSTNAWWRGFQRSAEVFVMNERT
jgi:DNA-directed RNA polymerase specialized sigma24 family protein